MREPYDFIHHLQSVWSGLDSFRIFNLFIYVFIAWYIHNLVSWVFNDFFSNFPTPENAACIFCWHRGSNIPVKIHVVTNSTSPASSFTKLANSSSVSWSSVLHISILNLATKITLRKATDDYLTRDFFPRSFNPRNHFQYINFLNNFGAFSVVINPNFKSLFRYLTLKFLNIPVSRGCSLDVVFLCKTTALTFEYETNKIFRVTRSIVARKQDVTLSSSSHLSIYFSQHRIHNFACHPWFLILE